MQNALPPPPPAAPAAAREGAGLPVTNTKDDFIRVEHGVSRAEEGTAFETTLDITHCKERPAQSKFDELD